MFSEVYTENLQANGNKYKNRWELANSSDNRKNSL